MSSSERHDAIQFVGHANAHRRGEHLAEENVRWQHRHYLEDVRVRHIFLPPGKIEHKTLRKRF